MPRGQRETGVSASEAAVRRIRDLNERITESARSAGSASLDAYERLLTTVADYQESAGRRGGEWVANLGKAQARLTRELAEAYPSAARRLGGQARDTARTAAAQARRVPGVAEAEGEVKGVVASERDLPIVRYDSLTAEEVVKRLSNLSEVELGVVDAYERKHDNRKTVLDRIASLRG